MRFVRRAVGPVLCAFVAALLVLPLGAAAEVTTRSSGFSRGSLENIFPFTEGDTTVVEGVLPNDFIVIEYPGGEYRMLFTRQIGDEWQFDVWHGARRQVIHKGEPRELDLDGDGSPELVMTFTEQVLRKGTFVFSPLPKEDNTGPHTGPDDEHPQSEAPVAEENKSEAEETERNETGNTSPTPVAQTRAPTPTVPAPTRNDETGGSAASSPDYFSYKLAFALVVLIAALMYFTAKPVRPRRRRPAKEAPTSHTAQKHTIVSRRRLRR